VAAAVLTLPATAAADTFSPEREGRNYYPSRLDFRLAGGERFRCENLRSAAGCGLRRDCEAVPFSYLALALSPDTPRADAPCPRRDSTAPGGGRKRCLPRKLRLTSHGLGPARLGRSLKAFKRRYQRARRGYCVRGGGRFVVGGRRGKITFVGASRDRRAQLLRRVRAAF